MELQMSWQDPPRGNSSNPAGLKNFGNSCYVNGILQCLAYTPPLANFCLGKQHSSSCKRESQECPMCLLESQISRLLSRSCPSVAAPTTLARSLHRFVSSFSLTRQQDAQEFLLRSIESCDDPILSRIFGGAFGTHFKCLSCNDERGNREDFVDVSVDVNGKRSLKEALDSFFETQILHDCFCSRCNRQTQTSYRFSIAQPPNVLVLHLKRFSDCNSKIDAHVAFQERLELAEYTSVPAEPCNGNGNVAPVYHLYAAVVHLGKSTSSGHYYAYVKIPNGRWYKCDDTRVDRATAEDVLRERVYILFYQLGGPTPTPSMPISGVQRPNEERRSRDNGAVANGSFTSVDVSISELEFDELKRVLVDQTRQALKACGWCEDVKKAMRESRRKKPRNSAGDKYNRASSSELKKSIIKEVRETYIRRIPESVKQHLIEQLQSNLKNH